MTSDISITNSGIFESTKSVDYVGGIFSNSDNIEIHALRTNNGATDTERVKVKIANGPEIISATLDSLASSATSPHVIGTEEVKAGDIVNSEVLIDGKGVSINNISISVQNEGISKGTQTSFSSAYSKTTTSSESVTLSYNVLIPGHPVHADLANGTHQITATFEITEDTTITDYIFISSSMSNISSWDITNSTLTYPDGTSSSVQMKSGSRICLLYTSPSPRDDR